MWGGTKSNKFAHTLLFKEGGALDEGSFEVFIGLFCFITNENIMDDRAGLLVEGCYNVVVSCSR